MDAMRASGRRGAILFAVGISAALIVGPSAAKAAETPATPYIVNGTLATIGQYPFYVQVFARAAGQGTFFCGGSVVASRIVITAAHCVVGVDRVDVIVGSDRLGTGRRIRVERWVLRGYNPATSQNDVALLHLSESAGVVPIKVVGPNSDYRWEGAGHVLRVVGMGCTDPLSSVCNSPSGGPSTRLRHAPVDSRSDAGCDADLGIWGGIDPRSMLCAGSLSDPFGSHNAPNACYGDSGGPLIVAGPSGTPRLVGAVSWGGVNCGDYPVAYARLARFRSWLASEGVPIERDPFDPGPPIDVADHKIPVVGDFNGDDNTDVLWFGAGTLSDRVRLGKDGGGFRPGPEVDLRAGTAPVVGDFNGDHRDDLLVYEPGPAADSMRLGSRRGFVRGPEIDIARTFTAIAGDFNGDSRDDVLLYAAGESSDMMRMGSSDGRLRRGPEVSVDRTFTRGLPGDYNGDHIDDILWFGSGAGSDMMRFGTRTGTFRSGPAMSLTTSAIPLVADFTGEGRDDIFWFVPDGTDTLREARATARFSTGPEVRLFGDYAPFTGDFDGDGIGDVFCYRPGTGSDKVWLGNRA